MLFASHDGKIKQPGHREPILMDLSEAQPVVESWTGPATT